MTPQYTYEQLVERIVRARVALESVPGASHKMTCPMEDLESYASCNCGESERRRPIETALAALKL